MIWAHLRLHAIIWTSELLHLLLWVFFILSSLYLVLRIGRLIREEIITGRNKIEFHWWTELTKAMLAVVHSLRAWILNFTNILDTFSKTNLTHQRQQIKKNFNILQNPIYLLLRVGLVVSYLVITSEHILLLQILDDNIHHWRSLEAFVSYHFLLS